MPRAWPARTRGSGPDRIETSIRQLSARLRKTVYRPIGRPIGGELDAHSLRSARLEPRAGLGTDPNTMSSRCLSPGSIAPHAQVPADSWIPGTSPGMTALEIGSCPVFSGTRAAGSEPAGLPPMERCLHQLGLDQIGDANDGDHGDPQDDQLGAGLSAIAEAGAGNAQRHHLLAVADVERRALATHARAHPGLAQVDLHAGQNADALAEAKITHGFAPFID